MIQFNLLPEVKLDYIRAQRTKRVVVVIASLAAAISVGIMVVLFLLVNILQKNHMNHLTERITKNTNELKAVPDLNKILTIQNQLKSLPAMHDDKAVVSRLYGYISQLTPNDLTISKLTADFSSSTMIIEGEAVSLELVNKFIDTLKFTEYTAQTSNQTDRAFSNVVMSDFARNADTTTYKVDLSFNPVIFDSADITVLTVPQIVSTRSETEQPNPLFQENTTEGEAQ